MVSVNMFKLWCICSTTFRALSALWSFSFLYLTSRSLTISNFQQSSRQSFRKTCWKNYEAKVVQM